MLLDARVFPWQVEEFTPAELADLENEVDTRGGEHGP